LRSVFYAAGKRHGTLWFRIVRAGPGCILINVNQVEHLLVVLNEEAVEIAHITDKILRFGKHDRNVLNPEGPTNIERLTDELNDLMGTIQLLVNLGVLPENWSTEFQQEAKKEKIRKFMEYARKQGTLK
jgi:hypothetical protein